MNRIAEHWPLLLILALSVAVGLAMWPHQGPKRKTLRPEDQIDAERRQLDEDFKAMHAPPTSQPTRK